MKTSESIKEIVSALAKAQAAFPMIPKDKTVKVTSRTGRDYSFAYAPLETILGVIRPTLSANGLAFTQSVSGDALTTILLHTSGEWIESDPIPVKAESAGAQALGSAITYARRYALTAILGLVTEDDDDGNTADGNHVETKKAPDIRNSATHGMFERLALDVQNGILDHAHRVSTLIKKGDISGAYAELSAYDDEGYEDRKAALWSRFDSKERSALTAEGKKRRADQPTRGASPEERRAA